MRLFRLAVHGSPLCVALFVVGCGEGDIRGDAITGGAGGKGGSANPSGGSAGAASGGTSAGGAASGGLSGSAGTAGSSTSGGSSGSGGSGGADPCDSALFCDDFEDYDVDADPGGSWVLDENNGAVTVDDVRAVSGTKSVRFDTNAGDYKSALIAIEGSPFPVTGNAFWGRMMVYMTQAANDGVHWSMILGEGPDDEHGLDLASVRYGGQHEQRLMANYWSEPNMSDCWHHSETATMPEGDWACMEWFFDGPNQTMQFWLDSAAVEDLTVIGMGQGCIDDGTGGNWYFPNFERVAVGWQSYQTDDARELWIDDVALALERIGCP